MGAISSPEAAQYYSERTNRGQLIISEATGVNASTTGYGYPNTPGLHSQEQIDAWKPVTKAVHDKGGIFFAQIWHTGRASHPAYHNVPDGDIYHPTTFEPIPYNTIVPRPLETDEVATYVEYFRTAARNAVEAGFDGIEIHGANGYLVNQFLEDGVNRRADKYGGSIANRCRFCLEIVEAVTKEIGSDRVGIRLGPFTGFLGVSDSDPYALYLHLVEQLNKFNLAYVHFIEPRVASEFFETGKDASGLKDSIEPFAKLCNAAVISAGGYVDRSGKLDGAVEALSSGHADLVAFGRWALANPDLLKRFKLDAPLNKYDRNTFYVPGPAGYIDYPFLEATEFGAQYSTAASH